jgi:hypothetical protein
VITNTAAAAGSGFLIAVLWFDLMFDVQTRRHAGPTLPLEVLASISAYYRRVTTDANPMGRLVAVVMGLTSVAIVLEIVQGDGRRWTGWLSLAIALCAFGLTGARTLLNAVRLGRAADPPDVQTRCARTIYRDHLFSLAAMTVVLGLQLTTGL